MSREDRALALAAVLAGAVFFSMSRRVWPLVPGDLFASRARLEERSRRILAPQGLPADAQAATRLSVHADLVDHFDSAVGRSGALRLASAEGRFVERHVTFLAPGRPERWSVGFDGKGRLRRWSRSVEDDEPGARLDRDAALEKGRAAFRAAFDADLSSWDLKHAGASDLPVRRNHSFTFERPHPVGISGLREAAWISIAGDSVVSLGLGWITPPAWRRAERREGGWPKTLASVGNLFASVAALAALAVILGALGEGRARLAVGARAAVAVAFCLFTARLLQSAWWIEYWDPLEPQSHHAAQWVIQILSGQIFVGLAVFVFFAAADALDRAGVGGVGYGRGASLRALLGSFEATAASIRYAPIGFRALAVGLLCGATLVAATSAVEVFAGGKIPLQPRGYFLTVLDAPHPTTYALLFFLATSSIEEIGYRYFAGTWILRRTGRSWLAILAPAAVYGLAHADFAFLPPTEPAWGRAFCLAAVGAVWGWAFLRFDALTVIASHWIADLFIFHWPALAAGDAVRRLTAAAAIAAPVALLAAVDYTRISSSRERRRTWA